MPDGGGLRRHAAGGWRGALLALSLAVTLPATDVALVRVDLPPAALLLQHWQGTAMQRVLDDAVAAPLHARIKRWLSESRTGSSDAAGVLAACRGVTIAYAGSDADGQPQWAVQADLGTHAPRVARGFAATYRFPWPTPVPIADESWELDGSLLARFAGIVAFGRPAGLLPLPPARIAGDIGVQADIRGLAAVLPVALDAPWLRGVLAPLAMRWSDLAVRAGLAPAGTTWSGRLRGDPSGLRPVDGTLLAVLPSDATAVLLLGVDGPAAARSYADMLLALAAALRHGPDAGGADAIRRTIDELAPGAGGIAGLIAACDGTIALLQTPGVPFPGISLVLPRHAALDALAEGLCRRLSAAQPVVGAAVLLPVEGLPVQLMLVRGSAHWLLTTDARLASAWEGPSGGGLDAAPLGRELALRMPPRASVMVVGDAGAVLRSLLGLAGEAPWPARLLNDAERQALIAVCSRLSAQLGPAYQSAVADRDGLLLAGGGGDLTWLAVPVLGAAWAVPAWIEASANTAEASAVTTLRHVLLPAQMQFQSVGAVDQDGDGTGEFGLLSELARRRPVAEAQVGRLKPLAGPLAQGDVAGGYRFAVFLPDGRDGALGEPAAAGARPALAPDAVSGIDQQEGSFVIYAWPARPDAGRRMFAVDQRGQIREHAWDGHPPAWNSLYDDGGWDDEPSWPMIRRGERRR